MRKLFSIGIIFLMVFSLAACEGPSTSNKMQEEISNLVLGNIDTLSSKKEIEFFDYETTGLSIGGFCCGYEKQPVR